MGENRQGKDLEERGRTIKKVKAQVKVEKILEDEWLNMTLRISI